MATSSPAVNLLVLCLWLIAVWTWQPPLAGRTLDCASLQGRRSAHNVRSGAAVDSDNESLHHLQLSSRSPGAQPVALPGLADGLGMHRCLLRSLLAPRPFNISRTCAASYSFPSLYEYSSLPARQAVTPVCLVHQICCCIAAPERLMGI